MMSHAQAITDGDTVLATIDVDAAPQRVFEAMTTLDFLYDHLTRREP